MVEPCDSEVLGDIGVLVDIEFAALGYIRKAGFRPFVGLCLDGMIAVTPAIDLSGKPMALVTIRISEATISRLSKSALSRYFQRNRVYAIQSLDQYLSEFSQSMRKPKGEN